MAKKEIYRLDIKIGIKGDSQAKKKLTATERFAKSSEKRMKALDKIKSNPSAKLNDKLSAPLNKIESKIKKVSKVKINPTVTLNDKVAKQVDKINSKIGKIDKTRIMPDVKLNDNASKRVEEIRSKIVKINKRKASPTIKLNDKASENIDKVKNKTDKISKVKATPTVKIKDQATKSLDKIQSKILSFSKTACTKLTAIATAGTIAIGGIGIGTSIKTFANFEQGMKNVQATSQATNEEFKQLWDTAKDLGAKTSFSAKEASDGMNYLAMAGFKTNEIISAMPGLLDLAAAAGSDLGVTSDIVSDAITAFGLKAKDTTHLADVMAKASSTANTNVEMLGESFKYAAAPATAFGMSAEETTAALSMMANAGIKSSMAGTALRGALTRLTKPSDSAAIMMDKLGIKIADSKGKIKPFNQIMAETRKGLSKLTQEEKQSAIATIFGQEAMSGMLAVLNTSTEDFEKYTQMLRNADGTAKDMANMKLDSLSGQFTILKSAVEGMNIELGTRLAPHAKKFVTWFTGKVPDITDKIVDIADKICNLATAFDNLNPGTKKLIGYLALGVITVNPLVKGINGVANGVSVMVGLGPKVGSFFKLFKGASTISKTTTTVAKGAGLASKGIGLLGLSAKASALLLNPWTWGIGAATYAGVKLYKHLKKDSIPTVQCFSDKVSDSTKKSVGAFMDLEENATKSLNQLKWSGEKVTNEVKNSLSSNFNEMTSQITTKIDENNKKGKQTLQSMFATSKTLSNKEKQVLITNTEKAFKGKSKKIIEGNAKIQGILNNAISKNRQLTQKEYDEIFKIKAEMMSSAVQVMSESEAEQSAILERLKTNTGIITAQQAADVVKNSLEQKEKTIANAKEEYNERLKVAAMLRAEGGAENEKLADKVVSEAQRQFKESTEKAEAMHTEVVEHARQQAGEHAAQVEWETGQVKSNFDIMMDKIREFNKLTIKEKVIKITRVVDNFFKKNETNGLGNYSGPGSITKIPARAKGTNFHSGGLVIAGEKGRELLKFPDSSIGLTNDYATLYNFPTGTKIIPNSKTEKILRGNDLTTVEPKIKLSKNYGENYNQETQKSQPRFTVAQPQLAGAGGGNNINVDVDMNNNFNSNDGIDKIVQQAMQEFGYKLKEALKNTK